MPEIINPGKIPEPRIPFPIGEKLTCSHCGCVWKIVDGDTFDTLLEKCPGGKRIVNMGCPTCAKLVVKDCRNWNEAQMFR